jgi:hypothetical protein
MYLYLLAIWQILNKKICINNCSVQHIEEDYTAPGLIIISLSKAGEIIQGHKIMRGIICALSTCFTLHVMNREVLAQNLHVKIKSMTLEQCRSIGHY